MTSSSRIPDGLVIPILIARIGLVAGVCVLVGLLPYWMTRHDTEIVVYSAPKETPRKITGETPGKGEPSRLWGAIVPVKSELWFFKLTGPVEQVESHEAALKEFLQSVRFERGEPTWKAPDDWTLRPGNEFRFATLLIPSDKKPLELTVTKLPRSDEPLDGQLLANINRWRGQVSLPPLKSEELTSSVEQIKLSDVEATVVNLVGIAQANSMGRPPFAGR